MLKHKCIYVMYVYIYIVSTMYIDRHFGQQLNFRFFEKTAPSHFVVIFIIIRFNFGTMKNNTVNFI